MADNSSLLGGRMPMQQRRPDVPTLLRGLGAAATGQVPQFRQQMQAEEQQRRQMALQDIQMQDILTKSAAQDALAIQGFARTGNLQGAADILGDRANLLSNIGADPSSTMRLQEQLMSGGFEAILPQINTTVQNATRMGLIKGDEFVGVEKGVAMFRTPGGGIRTQPVAGIPATSPEEIRKAETDLRKEFNALPQVKDFAIRSTALDTVLASAEDPSPAGDISLIFAYMKMLDPNSVVREGEFATAQSAGSVPESIWAKYNQAVEGTRLAPTVRDDFVDRAKRLYNSNAASFGRVYQRYESLAKRTSLNPENALIDYRESSQRPSLPLSAISAGVSPEVWSAMTEEERALF